MLHKIVFVLSIFSTLAFAQANPRQLCSGVKQCLGVQLGYCTSEDSKPLDNLEYTAEVCAPFRELKKRGLDFKADISKVMLSSLGGEYRVLYEVGGVLPINVDMMNYLMDQMPFTAELINAYQKTAYRIDYLEPSKKRFKGDNGRSLRGTFRWVSADSAGHLNKQRNLFWGLGTAKVLLWELHGLAVIFLDYDAVDQKHIRYRLRSIVFPSNSMLNSVMKMDLFKKVATEKMQLIVGHIESSARRFGSGERKPIDTAEIFKKDPQMREYLQRFDAVVRKSGYYSNKQ